MLKDWKYDAMQYRDIDREAQRRAEAEINKEAQMAKEWKVFGITNGSGEIKRLMQAKSAKIVRNVLIFEALEGVEIAPASTMTVAKLVECGMKVEIAGE